MIVAFTGHRLGPKLLGFQENYLHVALKKAMTSELLKLNPDLVIVGGAIGVDTWAAEIALENKIPYLLAVPFIGQERIWPQKSQDHYKYLKSTAAEVVIVCEGGYSSWKMQKRNEYMVNRCDKLIAVWDGTSGGTGNCVKYAGSINKEIIQINPDLFKIV